MSVTPDVDPQAVAAVARKHAGPGDYPDKLAKYAAGAVMAGSSSVAEITRENREADLQEEFGVSLDTLIEEAREYEHSPAAKADVLEDRSGRLMENQRAHWEGVAESEEPTDDPSGGHESLSELAAEIRGHNAEPEDLALVDKEAARFWKALDERMGEASIDRDELVFCRKSDAELIARERERLRSQVDDFPTEALSGLSMAVLRRLAESEGSSDDLTPDPRSGDPDPGRDTFPDADAKQEAEALKEKLSVLQDRSGTLAEKQREVYQQQLAEIEGDS